MMASAGSDYALDFWIVGGALAAPMPACQHRRSAVGIDGLHMLTNVITDDDEKEDARISLPRFLASFWLALGNLAEVLLAFISDGMPSPRSDGSRADAGRFYDYVLMRDIASSRQPPSPSLLASASAILLLQSSSWPCRMPQYSSR